MEELIYRTLNGLKRSIMTLNILSTIILIIIITYLGTFLVIIFNIPFKGYGDKEFANQIIIMGFVISIMGIVILYIHSNKKVGATILYEELTTMNEEYQNSKDIPIEFLESLVVPEKDEHEIEMREFIRKNKYFTSKKHLESEIKISIKRFLKTTDLPFTKGKSGEIFYLIIFISFIVIMGYMKIIFAS
jgi:hypothetical protein